MLHSTLCHTVLIDNFFITQLSFYRFNSLLTLITIFSQENIKEQWPNVSEIISKRLLSLGSRDFLKRRFPILKWLPKYKKSYIIADLVAGLTVALTVIPQGIADAALAGLPTEYGLYAGFMGCFVYFL
jgi:sodium-independent sulfate anion transporter 11